MTKEEFKTQFIKNLELYSEKDYRSASIQEYYECLVSFVKEYATEIHRQTSHRHIEKQEKKVYYFSMEFLIGRLLENYLLNLGIKDEVEAALTELGVKPEAIYDVEPDPGLGNGGLGRLAACFLDSMAACGVPGVGMGIRYRFGLFKQKFENGYQTEEPDPWLETPYPWEVPKPADSVEVRFGGRVDRSYVNGEMHFEHKDYTSVEAIPYDIGIVGFAGKDVNTLRLWNAVPMKEKLDMDAFNKGDYSAALKDRSETEAICCILYPDDSMGAGKRLRLKQEYFFTAAGIESILRKYKKQYGKDALTSLPEHVSIHINDTHPTLVIPELMRKLIDEENLSWDEAWDITTRTVSFTNHTVLPEALEKWDIELFRSLLPRVYMMVEEIDRRWRETLEKIGENNIETVKNTAVLWDGQIRMANLSIIGSYAVNGVAELHSKILKDIVFPDFARIFPGKFSNKTNGVSHRRFMIQSNPGLTALVNESIGTDWQHDYSKISEIAKYSEDPAFLERLQQAKYENKLRLASYISRETGIAVDPSSVFDIQVKRIHAYKRQLLNAFKVLNLYNELKEDPHKEVVPTTFIFSGKAAQGYAFAKESIKFVNSLAQVVNRDRQVSDKIKLVFLENFRVSSGQLIYPAADISEQISTAGKEASGTGNMKFMMNGAVTLGTLDGANVEILKNAGKDNIKIFGLTADETENYYRNGGYNSRVTACDDPRLNLMMNQLISGFFADGGCDFWGIYDAMLQHGDEYFVLKDFDPYMKAWTELTAAYKDKTAWAKMSLANIAGSGYFTSDRTIGEYAREIWGTGFSK